MKNRYRYVLITFVAGVLASAALPASAASSRSWNWDRWDVTISKIDSRGNSFHVTEVQTIQVTSGSFAGGDRSVSLDKLNSIDNVTVSDGRTPLRLVAGNSADSCPLAGGIFCLFTTGSNERDIYYNFLQRAYAGQTRQITLDYDVHGGLRSYPGGVQL